MGILWAIWIIKYIYLQFRKYDTWKVKSNYKLSVLDGIKTLLETKDLLGNKWIKIVYFQISIS